jgi:hypothetical protein
MNRASVRGLVAVLIFAAAASAGDELVPTGRPEKLEEGQPPQFAVWRDDEGFHVRVTTEGKQTRYKGTIAVKGGTIDELAAYDAANAAKTATDKRAFRGGTDRWALDDKKAVVTFDFVTDKLEDGVDLKLSAGVETVELDFESGSGGKTAATKKNPARVFVGAKGAHPKEVPFTLTVKMKK